MNNRANWNVDYTVIDPVTHVSSRQRRYVNQSQIPGNGNSPFAVQSFLSTMHVGKQILINSMTEA